MINITMRMGNQKVQVVENSAGEGKGEGSRNNHILDRLGKAARKRKQLSCLRYTLTLSRVVYQGRT